MTEKYGNENEIHGPHIEELFQLLLSTETCFHLFALYTVT